MVGKRDLHSPCWPIAEALARYLKHLHKVSTMDVRQAAVPSEPALYPPRVVPPARPLNLLNFLGHVVRNPLEALPEAVYREPFFRKRTMAGEVVWVTSPPLVDEILQGTQDAFPKSKLDFDLLRPLLGKGLLTCEGDDWRWQHKIVAPLFRHQEILRYIPHMSDAAEEQLNRWRAAPDGAVQQIDDDMTSATFQVIARTMLRGADADLCPSIARDADDFLKSISWPVAYGLVGLPVWAPFPGRARMRRAVKNLRGCVAQIIAQRRQVMATTPPSQAQSDAAGDPLPDEHQRAAHNDLLARTMNARHPETGATMSDRQILDSLLTFLLAGHETTARALTWTLYLLALAPHWQQRLYDEIRGVVGDAAITGAHLNALPELRKVIKESMRLYPPVPVMTRVPGRNIRIGTLNLKAGTLVIIPIYSVHRHHSLWHDPDRFDPERFDPGREGRFARRQFMPFGAGPRICIGSSFAMIEATTILASLLRSARFDVAGNHHPTPVARITLRPKGGMPLKVSLRA